MDLRRAQCIAPLVPAQTGHASHSWALKITTGFLHVKPLFDATSLLFDAVILAENFLPAIFSLPLATTFRSKLTVLSEILVVVIGFTVLKGCLPDLSAFIPAM